MDIQYINAITNGSMKVKLLATCSILLNSIATTSKKLENFLQSKAPICDHYGSTILNCGLCYDNLVEKHEKEKEKFSKI